MTLNNKDDGFSRTVKTDDQGIYQFLEVPPATLCDDSDVDGLCHDEARECRAAGEQSRHRESCAAGAGQFRDRRRHRRGAGGEHARMRRWATTSMPANSPIFLPKAVIPSRFLSLQPGVVYLGNQVDQNDDSRGGSVNGARSDQTNVTLDGLDDNDQLNGFAFQGAMRATLDSLQEFRVTTSNYDASAGRSSGAQVNLVTKSGTNSFHGSVYEYHRPSVHRRKRLVQQAGGTAIADCPTCHNIFCATLSAERLAGPIKKDRLFFFAAYEGQRTADQMQATRIVPTASLKAGQLKYLCNAERSRPVSTATAPLIFLLRATRPMLPTSLPPSLRRE